MLSSLFRARLPLVGACCARAAWSRCVPRLIGVSFLVPVAGPGSAVRAVRRGYPRSRAWPRPVPVLREAGTCVREIAGLSMGATPPYARLWATCSARGQQPRSFHVSCGPRRMPQVRRGRCSRSPHTTLSPGSRCSVSRATPEKREGSAPPRRGIDAACVALRSARAADPTVTGVACSIRPASARRDGCATTLNGSQALR
jgi:hypothetical protein